MEKMVRAIKEGEIVRIPRHVAVAEELFILGEVAVEEKPKPPKMPETGRRNLPVYRLEYKKNYVVKELIENFHWEIIKQRRARNITRKKAADAMGVPENELGMLERGELPRDDFVLVSKVENYFAVNLRKNPSAKHTGTNLLDLQKARESFNGQKQNVKDEKKDQYKFSSKGFEVIE